MAQILVQLAVGLLAMTFCIPSMAEGGVFGTQAIVQLTLTLSAYVAAYGLVQLVLPRSDRGSALQRFRRRPTIPGSFRMP